jgi:hypothetical protein
MIKMLINYTFYCLSLCRKSAIKAHLKAMGKVDLQNTDVNLSGYWMFMPATERLKTFSGLSKIYR